MYSQIESMPQIIEQRQAYLRSLAGHRPGEIAPEPVRRRVGRVVVRFGQWVEGHRPEERAEIFPVLAGASSRAGGSLKRA